MKCTDPLARGSFMTPNRPSGPARSNKLWPHLQVQVWYGERQDGQHPEGIETTAAASQNIIVEPRKAGTIAFYACLHNSIAC